MHYCFYIAKCIPYCPWLLNEIYSFSVLFLFRYVLCNKIWNTLHIQLTISLWSLLKCCIVLFFTSSYSVSLLPFSLCSPLNRFSFHLLVRLPMFLFFSSCFFFYVLDRNFPHISAAYYSHFPFPPVFLSQFLFFPLYSFPFILSLLSLSFSSFLISYISSH